MRGLEEFQAKYPDVVVIALTIDDIDGAVDKVLTRYQLKQLRVAPAADWQRKFAVSEAIPVTVIVHKGRVRVIHDGVLDNPVLMLEADVAAVKNSTTEPSKAGGGE